MLSDNEARGLWTWVVAANSWSEAAQSLVTDATELATVSRDLADLFDPDRAGGSPPSAPRRRGSPVKVDRTGLARDLRTLASGVEDQTSELRDRYLATAADIKAYRSILG